MSEHQLRKMLDCASRFCTARAYRRNAAKATCLLDWLNRFPAREWEL